MTVTLSDAARQYLVAFEDATGAEARDCVVDEEEDRLLILVTTGDMAQAIGPGGENVRKAEERIGKDVKLVEDAPTAEEFVANALAPAAVYNVTISENDGLVAYAEVAEEDTGVAIGEGGSNIDAARLLAERHFDIEDVQLT